MLISAGVGAVRSGRKMMRHTLWRISMIAMLSTSSSSLRRFAAISSRHCSTTRLSGHSYSFLCRTSDTIETMGKRLSSVLSAGDVILLKGDLGAGKTTLSRGIVREKFGDDEMIVTSPSYLLDNTYKYGENDYIHHMDLYRLPVGYPEMGILGIPAIFQSAICIIEWPNRLTDKNMPSSYLEVKITMPSSASFLDIPVFSPSNSAAGRRRETTETNDSVGDMSSGDVSNDEKSDGDCDEGGNTEDAGVEDEQPARVVTFRCVGERWQSKAQALHDVLSSSA